MHVSSLPAWRAASFVNECVRVFSTLNGWRRPTAFKTRHKTESRMGEHVLSSDS